ncbi:uncharacterized protein RCO7_10326 [Rhynchosporium graminicola]|uniref:Methyltransferase n=1 Tax=Rhynchosporium graminicola TaxID=2792576 RepID=A0A1E1K882_9HELO|nr:uncharacterized protein RCO7_10326 [Rhynchosporium commune]
MAGSVIGLEMEHRIEHVDSMASNLVWSGLGSPVQHGNDASHAGGHEHTEIIHGPNSHEDFDSDSALGLGDRHSTTTISSEALTPVEKYGRSYCAYQEGKYLMPNDEQERESLDGQHHLFRMTLGGRLHLAPLPTIQRALDIGTGTGIWSIQYGERKFLLDSFTLNLDRSRRKSWCGGVRSRSEPDAARLVRFLFVVVFERANSLQGTAELEAFKALAAGGIIEMQDVIFEFRSPDHSLEGSALATWAEKVKSAFGSKGIDLTSASRYKNDLETAGFEDIHQKEFI